MASIATIGTETFTHLKIMTATKLKLALSAIVVAGAATAFVIQNQTQEKLRAQNETLRQEMAQQIAQLQTDNEGLSNRLAAAGDAKKLPDEQFIELLKLRGEVGVLRNQVGELEKLRTENEQISKELADATQVLKSLPSPQQALFNQQSIKAVNDAKQIGLAMRIWAGDNNDAYPTNIYDMTNELGSMDFTKHVSETFELMNIGIANEHYPQMLMLREITPRQSPDGNWERIYGMADGSVQKIHSNNGNFDAWENAQEKEQFNTIYNPPKNQ
jgi:hypothetical protein